MAPGAPAASMIGGGGGGRFGGKSGETNMYYAEADASVELSVGAVIESEGAVNDEVTTESVAESTEESPEAEADAKPTIDLDRISRTLDRSLLLLCLGATPKEIKTLPALGLDGKPFLFEGTVEVTILCDKKMANADSVHKDLERVGLVIQGSATRGSIVVGRIPVAKLLDLAQVEFVKRIVPSS